MDQEQTVNQQANIKPISKSEDTKRNAQQPKPSMKKRLIIFSIIAALIIWAFFAIFKPFERSALEQQETLKERQEIFALYNSGQVKEVLPRLQAFDEDNPNDVAVKTLLASSNWLLGKPNEAEKIYKEILDIDPNEADTLYRLGILYRQLGKQDDSMDYLNKAVKTKPDVSLFRAELAKGFEASAKYNQALEQWKTVLKLIPQKTDYRASVWESIGDDYNKLGLAGEAKNAYKNGLKYLPPNSSQRQQLAKKVVK